MAEPVVMRFAARDEFLRRVMFYDHFKRGLLYWRAFKDKDPRLSWTFRDEELRTDVGLDEYHAYFSERVGEKLPAILRFTFHGLTKCIDPPLEPQHDRDDSDAKYGHLHCSTPAARDKDHMERLAKLVNDGEHAGIARRYPKALA